MFKLTGEIIKRTRLLRYFFHSLIYSNKYSKKIKQYHRSNEGETVVIVCNGPSLKLVDLDRIKYKTIGMNKINLIFDQTKWRPDYIISTNGLVINQNKDFFMKYDKPVFLDFKAKLMNISSKNICYFLSDYKRDFSPSFDKKIGSAGTVTYSALQLAYFLGFKKIYIIGMDHNYSGHDNKKSLSKIEKFEGEDINHFHPDYFKGNMWGTPNLFISELGYNYANDFLMKKKIKVTDATINGKCQIFKKGDINQIYKN